jgi:large subunit ribosomal protein L21
MYAVIETGGKQYRVELGTELEVELLDADPGQEINIDRVLLVVDGDKTAVGQPVVSDAAVTAEVLRQDRGEKTISFKYRPKARRRVKKGHRQELTILKITDVRLGSKSAAGEAKEAEAAVEAERAKVAKSAARQAAEDAALAEKLKARKAAAEAAPKAEPKTKAARGKAKAAEAPAAEEAAEPAEAAETPTKPAPKAKAEPKAKPVRKATAEPKPKATAEPQGEAEAAPAPRPKAKAAPAPKKEAPAADAEAEAPARPKRSTRAKKDE